MLLYPPTRCGLWSTKEIGVAVSETTERAHVVKLVDIPHHPRPAPDEPQGGAGGGDNNDAHLLLKR